MSDEVIYYLACKYMALTELFDRFLSDVRSPYDATETIVVDPTFRRWSARYACSLRHSCKDLWGAIHEEIKWHDMYKAQDWIDEYSRLKKEEHYKHYDIMKDEFNILEERP